MNTKDLDALIVLGCRRKKITSSIRASHAARNRREGQLIIVSGGVGKFEREKSGATESDLIAEELVRLGIPEKQIKKERCSTTTYENFLYSAEIIKKYGIKRLGVVTSSAHMARSLAFGREALREAEIECGLYPVYPNYSARDFSHIGFELKVCVYEIVKGVVELFSGKFSRELRERY